MSLFMSICLWLSSLCFFLYVYGSLCMSRYIYISMSMALHIYFSLCLCLSLCVMSLFFYVCTSMFLCLCLPFALYASMSMSLSLHPPCSSLCPSLSLAVYVCLSLYISMSMSLSLRPPSISLYLSLTLYILYELLGRSTGAFIFATLPPPMVASSPTPINVGSLSLIFQLLFLFVLGATMPPPSAGRCENSSQIKFYFIGFGGWRPVGFNV